MTPSRRRSLAATVLLGALAIAAAAGAGEQPALRFANIFGDHMVLQQGKPVRIWGWAEPGAEVAVSITIDEQAGRVSYFGDTDWPFGRHQTKRAKADAKGAWQVVLDPMPAALAPSVVVARSGGQQAVISDVLVGEIWVCSGQSNMVWGNWCAKNIEQPGAIFAGIRYVRMDATYYKPLDDLERKPAWTVCSPEAAKRFAAVPYLFARFLHLYLRVPVGIVMNARGGTTGQAWCSRDALDSLDVKEIREILAAYDAETARWDDDAAREQILKDWEAAVAKAKEDWQKKADAATQAGKKPPRLRPPRKPGDPRRGWSPPAGMFNAVVWPIRKLAIRGVLYYQGENNQFGRWSQYEHTFPKVIASHRAAFGEPGLPFGIITMPGWGDFETPPEVACVADGYAIVRDIQTRVHEKTPGTGLITIYDVGNSFIHPHWKRPVGERAARWALVKVYGKTELRHRGPKFREMKKQGSKLLLWFTPDPVFGTTPEEWAKLPIWAAAPVAREGKAELRGFVIAGADRRWYPAQAKVNSKERCLEVWSDLVPEPVAVRYGWAQWPTGNLCCNHNLPTPTFRTDDWPLPRMYSHTPEQRDACRKAVDEQRRAAQIQALDRAIREAMLSPPKLERELYLGRIQRDPRQLLRSKAARVEAILQEYGDDWLTRYCAENNPAVAAKLQALEEARQALVAELDKLPEGQ